MRENGDRVGPSIESNNFDAIRLIAALCVLISHAFPLTYGSDEFEPVYRWSHGQTTIGTIAVGVFFAISGFLITRSFVHAGRSWGGVSRFVRARVLRLVPALLVALLLLAFLFGPLVSSQPIADYFQFPQMVRFILINCSFVSFHDTLPGVFIHNPFPNSVDGSLWTLRHEVRCYLMIFLLGVAGLLKSPMLIVLYGSSLAILFWHGSPIAFLFACFLGGALIYSNRLPIDNRAAVVCLVALAASAWLGLFGPAAPIFGSYLVIWLALSDSVRLPRLAKYGDFSYGVYIYAFPVQQLVTQMMADRATWYWNIAISAPITLILGIASWFLIERPALALKRQAKKAEPARSAAYPAGAD